MSRIFLIYGPTGSTKSTFALSGPSCFYAELDPGSYSRARKGKQVDLHQYHAPLTALEDFGVLDRSMTGQSGLGAIQIAHHYHGWREVYWEFIKDYLEFLKSGPAYGVIDTSTILWDMAQNALRQRIQEEGGSKEIQSDRLKRLEYAEPGSQLTQVIQGAKGVGKDLVLVAHRGEVWFNDKPTGRWKPDGWNKAMDYADIALMFEVRSAKPVATITKAGGCHLELVGWELESPTLEMVSAIIDAAQALSDAELELPTGENRVRELLAQGEMLHG